VTYQVLAQTLEAGSPVKLLHRCDTENEAAHLLAIASIGKHSKASKIWYEKYPTLPQQAMDYSNS